MIVRPRSAFAKEVIMATRNVKWVQPGGMFGFSLPQAETWAEGNQFDWAIVVGSVWSN
jgi:hypothetical protein